MGDEHTVICGYGEGCLEPIGIINVLLNVDCATAQTDVYVVPDNSQNIPLIVG